jgi:hypothetical protein
VTSDYGSQMLRLWRRMSSRYQAKVHTDIGEYIVRLNEYCPEWYTIGTRVHFAPVDNTP